MYDLAASRVAPIATVDAAGSTAPIAALAFSPGRTTRWLAVGNLAALSLYRVSWAVAGGARCAEAGRAALQAALEGLDGE